MINKNSRQLITTFGCLLGMLLIPFGTVVAQSDLDPKLVLVRDNCTNAKMIAVQLQKRDAVSRINRGRAYDQLLRQMQAINSRFAYNKLDASGFTDITNNLQADVDKFRTNYTAYDDDLSNAIKTDCKQAPEVFYGYIVKSKQKREELSAAVNKIDSTSVTYRTALDKYQQNIDSSSRVTQP